MKLTIEDGRDSFYTFDTNRILLLTATDEEQINQVEFSTEENGETVSWTSDVLTGVDGIKFVQVPNEFLNGGYSRLVCYVVALDSKGEYTRQKEIFRIRVRQQPEDYFLTYSERTTFASIKALTEQYKTNASESADLARRYAEESEDVNVEAGTYSSKHWSIKAEAAKETAVQKATEAGTSEANSKTYMESAQSAKQDAETAKNAANTILEQVQSKGTEITNFVATSKTEIETQKNESVNAVKSVYQTDLNELKGDLSESGTKRIYPNYTLGKYIFPWGGTSVRDDNRFKLSEPFAITKGTKVVVKAKGYDNNQTIIAETNAEASIYHYLVNSIDGVYRDYEYIAPKDMYIAVSGALSSSYPIVITTIERYKVYDIDETQVKNDILAFSTNVTSSSILADFNNAERNRIYLISTSEIANIPVQESGTLLCIGHGNGYSAQIYQTLSGSVYVRHGIGNNEWVNWVKLGDVKNNSVDATKVTTDIVAIGENIWKPSLLPNFDNAKLNRIYTISSVDEENIPVKESGTLLCLGENEEYAIQMYSSFGSGLFYRQRRGTSNGWTDWTQVVGGSMSLSDYASVAMFEKVGVIGDSYSSGNIWKSNTESRGTFYNLSWCQLMARRNGITVTNYSKDGLSTRTWLTDNMGLSKLNSSEKENLYILALGINDYYGLGMDYLGSISDIHDGNPSENADTFYGNYGRIVEAIKTKAPKAKIIMASIPSNESDLQKAFNEAILNIANHYSVPHIKLYNDYFIKSAYYHIIGGHPNAVGYSGMCKSYERLIEECMTLNFDYFNDYTSEE